MSGAAVVHIMKTPFSVFSEVPVPVTRRVVNTVFKTATTGGHSVRMIALMYALDSASINTSEGGLSAIKQKSYLKMQ